MRIANALVAASALLLLAGCASSTAAPSPTPTVESPTVTPTPTASGPEFEAMDPSLFFVNGIDYVHFGGWDSEDVNFAAPSGGIGCGILDGEQGAWGCAISEDKAWTFPNASPDDYCYEAIVPCGWGIEAEGAGAPHPRLRSDPGYPGALVVGMPDAPVRVLEHGQSVSFNDVTCYSEQTGITCEHAVSGHGFVISRDRNDIY